MTDALWLPLAIIHTISLAIMAIMLLQFRRIHDKRISLLSTFQEDDHMEANLKRELVQRHILMWIYIVATIVITAISSGLFLIRPEIL